MLAPGSPAAMVAVGREKQAAGRAAPAALSGGKRAGGQEELLLLLFCVGRKSCFCCVGGNIR